MTQRQLEKELTKIYQQASKDIEKKWSAYFEKSNERISKTENALAEAKKAGDAELVKSLEKELIDEKKQATFQNEQYRKMVKETTKQMSDVNSTAAAYVNNQIPSFYQNGFNETIPEAVDAGIRFDMADEATVKRLVKDGDIQLPKRKVDIPKDERWNSKQISSNVLQGIIQGESMDKIAKRLEPIMDNNRKAAIRNARTLTNGAENLGRMDRAHELEEMGLVMSKVWIATGDDRTRDIHIVMDGQEVDLDEPFIDGDGNELQYPCDPDAEPETVYNCRCTYMRKVTGIRQEDGTIKEIDYDAESEFHKEQIEEEKERREAEGDENLEEAEAVVEDAENEEQEEFNGIDYGDFVPAASLEEAEEYISQYVDSSKFGAVGVSYKGIDLEVANEINKTITGLMTTFPRDKFGGIVCPAGNTKLGKAVAGGFAGYSPIRDSFVISRSSMKSIEVAEIAINQNNVIARRIYAQNPDINSADLSMYNYVARKAIINGAESGRITIAENVEDVICHEYGHALEKQVKEHPKWGEVKASREEYGQKVSGYACNDDSEYIAESFSSYVKGEDVIDPGMKEIFESLRSD